MREAGSLIRADFWSHHCDEAVCVPGTHHAIFAGLREPWGRRSCRLEQEEMQGGGSVLSPLPPTYLSRDV